MKYLLQTKKQTVTALTRAGGGSRMPEGVKVVEVNYDDTSTLVKALQGQDVLIISLAVTAPQDTQSKLISAAAEAKVPWIVPNEYGPDASNEAMCNDMLIGHSTQPARKQIEQLGVSKWVTLSCGFWYEWSLPIGKDTYGFDLKNREVVLFDDGEQKIDTSTWPQCGRALAGLLSLKVFPEDENDKSLTLESYANGFAFVTSFTVNQKDILASVLRVTGTKESDWKLTHENSRERWAAADKAFKSGDRSAFARTMYSRIWYPTGEGCFEQSGKQTVNKALNLPKENLDEYTKMCVDFVESGKSWFG